MSLEAAGYERRRVLAAFLGRPAPPGLGRPLAGGVLVSLLLVGVEVVRALLR